MLENNKALISKFFEILEGEERLPEELLDPSIIYHVPGLPPLVLKDMHKRIAAFSAAFSNGKRIDVVLIAEDDKVAFRSIIEGTHTGEFRGIAASNKQFSVIEMGIFRISNDKIVEMWGLMDSLGLMRQLGAIKV